MAKAWRELSKSQKAEYMSHSLQDGESDDEDSVELSPEERKKLVLKVAKRHQSDVSSLVYCIYSACIYSHGIVSG